jgi:sirohydrochlorin ferrochelatase
MSSAYLLVSHGSRDPRPQLAMEQLAKLISQRQLAGSINLPEAVSSRALAEADRRQIAGNSSSRFKHSISKSAAAGLATPPEEPLVGTACLELSAEPLHEQIKQFGYRVASRKETRTLTDSNRIQVVPLFLLPGVHVMEDIPAEVARAQQALGQEVKIDLRPHLGTHPGLSHLLASMVTTTADGWILLAHGSRRAGSKQTVEVIATQLGAIAAYWAISPKLESRVKQLVKAGCQQIGILPYFLFAGGITDAIVQSVEQLKVQFPSTNFQLAEPLGASAELADLIWDLIEK